MSSSPSRLTRPLIALSSWYSYCPCSCPFYYSCSCSCSCTCSCSCSCPCSCPCSCSCPRSWSCSCSCPLLLVSILVLSTCDIYDIYKFLNYFAPDYFDHDHPNPIYFLLQCNTKRQNIIQLFLIISNYFYHFT